MLTLMTNAFSLGSETIHTPFNTVNSPTKNNSLWVSMDKVATYLVVWRSG